MPTLSVHNSDYEPVDQLGNEPGVNLDELKRSRASLGDDLCSALDADFDWMGKHYFARSYARAESELDSVSMKIEGKDGGGFDLWTPLEPWHVEEFIENASQAPFGHGGEKLVDTSVRDTWEIEGSREIVLRDVWKGLGVAPFETEPRLDLYKLLLYKEGGHS
ncbi:hypothetical protein CC1G_15669 [Coprinopsis cinerea okayama7|uniref:Uncharacterized protein n=1 Tax=Coprinopsis cinerea (strain Okayama-7 / 130 / ATCC MYA-4618 / FGSC 9003) TaxID=240176 RepID=D6RQC9_COPC7|nr:hypothetical protein CC1G_15669 [Coprinopsis cinerea okayama7\|eukprot:XP_002910239.1 hypothetical protein CC1G_15669 [Coprinopsis cinerea okayama7\